MSNKAEKIEMEKIKHFRLDNINKKIVILYGNCHMQALYKLLNSSLSFNEKFVLYDIPYIQTIKNPAFFELPIFNECDVFIHQAIQINNRYGREFASENIIKKLKPSCKVIAIPNIYHLPKFYFPQYLEEPEYKWGIKNNKGTFTFRDRLIEDALRKGKSLRNIVDIYKDVNYEIDYIKTNYENFKEKILKREKDWDIKVSEFIDENITKSKLFFDPNHPRPIVIRYIAEQVLIKLGVVNNDLSKKDFLLDSFEMPICASVIAYFGLDSSMIDEKIRVNSNNKFTLCPLNLKFYVFQYFCMVWHDKTFPIKTRILSFICYCFATSYYYPIWFITKVLHRLTRIITKFL